MKFLPTDIFVIYTKASVDECVDRIKTCMVSGNPFDQRKFEGAVNTLGFSLILNWIGGAGYFRPLFDGEFKQRTDHTFIVVKTTVPISRIIGHLVMGVVILSLLFTLFPKNERTLSSFLATFIGASVVTYFTGRWICTRIVNQGHEILEQVLTEGTDAVIRT